MAKTKAPKPPREKKPERVPRAWRLPQDGSLVIGAPYRKDFVTMLKSCIHHEQRIYDETTHNWIVSREWAQTALDLFHAFYDDHGGEYWDNGWVPPAVLDDFEDEAPF